MDNRLRKKLELIKARARDLRSPERSLRSSVPDPGAPPMELTDATSGIERKIENECFYLIRLAGDCIADDAPVVAERFSKISERETWPLISLIRDPGPDMARRIADKHVCFMDIETTGLSPNTYVFLCGLMYVEKQDFVVEQLFARDYSEERGMLLYAGDVMRRYPMIITYNGSAFDVPFVQTRMAVARIERVTPFEHVDLLDPARARFDGVLPNCKLETIERHLRGRSRSGDIPGREIPEAYHEFVRTGDARQIERILYHNRMDLLAMAYLVNHLVDRV